LSDGGVSIGSWIQIPHGSIAEIMGRAGYDWIAVDLEHGSIAVSELPDLFRAIELGGTLPLARVAEGTAKDCKQALDAGAAGVIVPMIESAAQLERIRDACRWPPAGTRGVGFSRGNLFGGEFDDYAKAAQAPMLVPMLEHIRAVEAVDDILAVHGIDALLIGPYDLSASMGITARFDHPDFIAARAAVAAACAARRVPFGLHVVQPDPAELQRAISADYRFLAYSLDSVFLRMSAERPRAEHGAAS
jgi:2-dehydro-3-deoxyglucarate aldolase